MAQDALAFNIYTSGQNRLFVLKVDRPAAPETGRLQVGAFFSREQFAHLLSIEFVTGDKQYSDTGC
jgi:hypothetical protein